MRIAMRPQSYRRYAVAIEALSLGNPLATGKDVVRPVTEDLFSAITCPPKNTYSNGHIWTIYRPLKRAKSTIKSRNWTLETPYLVIKRTISGCVEKIVSSLYL